MDNCQTIPQYLLDTSGNDAYTIEKIPICELSALARKRIRIFRANFHHSLQAFIDIILISYFNNPGVNFSPQQLSDYINWSLIKREDNDGVSKSSIRTTLLLLHRAGILERKGNSFILKKYAIIASNSDSSFIEFTKKRLLDIADKLESRRESEAKHNQRGSD